MHRVLSCPRRHTEVTQGKRKGCKRIIQPEHGHHLFNDADPEGTLCPICGWSLERKRAEKVYMFPIGPRVRNILRNPVATADLGRQFSRPRRDGWISDVWDGDLYKEFVRRHNHTAESPWRAMAWKMSNDPVEMTLNGVSMTPVWFTNMSHSQVRCNL